MCRAYVNVVAEPMDHALQILDRFHIRTQNESVDDIRREETKAMAATGLNQLLKKKSTGSFLRTDEALELALFHSLGKLPEPELTHRFS